MLKLKIAKVVGSIDACYPLPKKGTRISISHDAGGDAYLNWKVGSGLSTFHKTLHVLHARVSLYAVSGKTLMTLEGAVASTHAPGTHVFVKFTLTSV
jgi:hypothetical protein